MDKTVIATPDAPAAIGPYSQGIAGNGLVFVSGQLPVDPKTGAMPETIEAQARQSLTNLKAIIEASGSSLDKVVKTTCFLADIADFCRFQCRIRGVLPERRSRTFLFPGRGHTEEREAGS